VTCRVLRVCSSVSILETVGMWRCHYFLQALVVSLQAGLDRSGWTFEADAAFRGEPVIVTMRGRQKMLGVRCTRCIPYSVYGELSGCCTRCMLHSV